MKAAKGLRRIWIDLLLFTGFFVLYIYTSTSYHTYDAVSYALSIRYAEMSGSPSPLFHPHHLLFNPLGLIAFRLLRGINPSVEPMQALQMINAFIGAIGVGVVYRFTRRLALDVADLPDPKGASMVAAASAAACGFSFGYWVAATDGRANMPGVVAAVIALYIAYDLAIRPSAGKAVALGIAVAWAALLHQSHLLILPAAMIAVVISHSRGRRKLRHFMWLSASLISVLTVPYLLAARIKGVAGLNGLLTWITTYAHNRQWWDFSIAGNIPSDLYALVHAYVADVRGMTAYTVFMWGFVGAPMILAAVFLVRSFVQYKHQTTEIAMQGCKSGEMHAEWILRDPGTALAACNAILITAAVVYAAFFTVWSPGYFPFWIPMAVIGMILVAVNSAAFVARHFIVAAYISIWAAALLFVNLTGYVIPKTGPESNPFLLLAKTVEAHTSPGDVVVMTGVGDLAQSDVYIPYFARRNVISLHQVMAQHRGFKPGAMNWLYRSIEQKLSEGKEVLLLGEVISSDTAWQSLGGRYGLTREDVRAVLSKYQLKLRFKWKDQVVYTLEKPDKEPLLKSQ